MAQRRRLAWGAAIAAVLLSAIGVTVVAARRDDTEERAVEIPTSRAPSTTSTSATTTTTTLPPPPETTAPAPEPPITAPSAPIVEATPVDPGPPVHRVYTYSVIVDGAVSGSVNDLRATAQSVWNDDRSWHAAGIDFVEVGDGGSFTLVLANPFEVPKYAPGTCDAEYSCTNGGYVVINDDRWVGGSGNWPGPLDQYRTMVLNHEVGHLLGLGHQYCGGGLAPVMQQQSIDLQGCAPNPWPLAWELDSVR